MNHLIELFSNEQTSEIHENVAAIWVEFIKALRDVQYNNNNNEVLYNDQLLESIQSTEIIKLLLNLMFPLDRSKQSLSVEVFHIKFLINVDVITRQ